MYLFVNEINALRKNNNKITIVSSGAIGFGKHKLNFSKKKLSIKEQQGLASIGQYLLMNEFEKRFSILGINVAQVLISQMDLNHKKTLTNIKNTLNFLFEQKVIPIINENDSVSTSELRKNGHFSDNDYLSALLAKKTNADLLVILTSTNGLIGTNNEIIKELKNKDELLKLNSKSSGGTGGIESKLKTIELANKNKIDVFISGGENFYGFSKGNSKGTLISKENSFC